MINRSIWLLFPASIAICLGLLGPRCWVRAQERGEVVQLGKLKSRVPTGWAQEKPDEPSGYKQYRLEPVGDDKDDARLTIDFLGKGSGDSAKKQVERRVSFDLPPASLSLAGRTKGRARRRTIKEIEFTGL
jgi:hypothetical protein